MRNYALLGLLLTQLNAQEPLWLTDPSMHGKYVGAIGCATDIGNVATQEKIALLRAKGSISQEIETDVEDKSHHESTLDNDDFEEDFDFTSEQKSSTTFDIKKMATYINKDKLLCVWIIKK